MRPSDQSLTDRTTHAARWRVAASAVAAISQFAVGVPLARLLAPTDFGVMALAWVVLGLARPLGDLGIGSAVVQRAALTERHIRSAFTFSVLLGLALAVTLAAAAPVGAAAMRDDRVTSVLRLLSIGFSVHGTSVVAGALLRRQLDFRRQFFVDIASYLVGYAGVAVSLALLGYGVWSLAWGSLVQSVVASAGQLSLVRHDMRPLLGRTELADLLHFGLGATAIACVNYLALNGDNFVVGRWGGAASLGLYAWSYNLMNLPFTYASSVMSSVLFPALARVQLEPARLQRVYLLLTELLAMVAASAMVTMWIAAPHLVRALYGPQWVGVVAPLQILCMAGYFRALYHLGGIVIQSVGRVYGELWRQAIYAGLVIAGALLGLRYGLAGVAAGVGAAIIFMFVATAQLVLRITATPWSLYFRVQQGALLTALVTFTVAMILRLLLEGLHASSVVTTLGILAGAAVPWSIGLLRTLGGPDFEPIRGRLPVSVVRLAATVSGRRQPQSS